MPCKYNNLGTWLIKISFSSSFLCSYVVHRASGPELRTSPGCSHFYFPPCSALGKLCSLHSIRLIKILTMSHLLLGHHLLGLAVFLLKLLLYGVHLFIRVGIEIIVFLGNVPVFFLQIFLKVLGLSSTVFSSRS
jgi:hypothetical protein